MERNHRDYPCEDRKVELLFCLLRSDCCQKKRLTPRQCLNAKEFPLECKDALQAFDLCRIELIDRRTRLRGRKYGSND
ncbi:hypothetical protein X801_06009 [Opisthorchis viverrini]|uniref:Cytochrome c oxidase assembly factor 5 n=1 Tax=Opisthorchis viverrini TaxID=6198 RepID=A0A1S8WUY5_OPIVI|nr:hypothetical protein X801_06009 [Opisthorchis viverrini]